MKSLIKHTAIGLTLLTAAGILIHDTKLDYATKTALALPAMLIVLDIEKAFKSGADHTHVERVTISQAFNVAGRGTPHIQSRNDHKKINLPQKVAKGSHPFDGYYLPLES